MQCSSDDVLILSAVRTPVGSLQGSLSSLPSCELGSVVIREALQRAGLRGDQVSEVIMGQILTAGVRTWVGARILWRGGVGCWELVWDVWG